MSSAHSHPPLPIKTAASALKFPLSSNRLPIGVVSPRRWPHSSGIFNIANFSGTSKRALAFPTSARYIIARAGGYEPARAAVSGRVSGSDAHPFDVVIVGAGIIGLTIARQFLLGSNLSVAIVDAAVPCAGATGAGQGYIWRVHKVPGAEKWELAIRSHNLWEALSESVQNQGMDPLETLGWKKTGSMLVGRTAEDCSVLRAKVEKLVEAGLGAQFLSRDELRVEEPALELGEEGGAAFMPDDCQLDARRAVTFLEKTNRSFAAEGRYAEFYHEPVTSFIRSESTGGIEAVQTSKRTLSVKKAVVIAAGCWSGSVVDNLISDAGIKIDVPVKPRKGHLLILENFKPFNLNHGLMEAAYVSHESAKLSSTSTDSKTGFDATIASVSMTATTDLSGKLVFGSSREIVGFDTRIDESILERIWTRASEFFPVLKKSSLRDLTDRREVRVGLRPYMPGGKPLIAPVPGLSKAFLAAGHEGEGLSLAMGTAEMIYDMVLENPPKVNPAPYAV
ncbi:D-amino acid dehydrogenase small subunit [Striga asiatica]|uniref:FAD-dependent oxidoreductase domain-containing protein 1 n=1 Tax=Striga asiatica TaxID=4170 RepID=A0A5A7R1C4_STRAF|nr:D-amino acid dehydrogenase small subunit [Striga asiatica]